jgi:hypothetical protein
MKRVGGFFVSTNDVRLNERTTHMKTSKLSVRINRKNTNHHLWNNNGKWWCHLTTHKPDYTAERHRIPLHTRDVSEARQRRDKLFAELAGKVFRKEVAV